MNPAAPPTTRESGRRSRPRLIGLILLSALGAVGAVVIGALSTQIFQDTAGLFTLLGAAWVALTIGRLLWYLDLPLGYGGVWAELGAGLALGLAGMGMLQAAFDSAALPWWGLAAGAAWGTYRTHMPIMRQLREAGAAPRRIGGILDLRELGALALLLVGYTLLGFAAWNLYTGIVTFGEAANFGALGLAVYALYGVRLLLRFAAHDAAPTQGGIVGWLKANLLVNAIFVVVLVGYAVYRVRLAEVVPYFPLVEFGLGMAVFGAVLARLRWRLRRDRADHASISQARPHVPRAEPLTEGEYEALARPVTRFIESGRGAREYELALSETARLEAPDAQAVLEPLRRYRAPVEDPPVPLAWAVGATALAGALLAAAAATLLLQVSALAVGEGGEPPAWRGVAAFALALLVLGLATYRAQDHARAHRRAWTGFGLAATGTALVALGGAIFLLGPAGSPAWGWWTLLAALVLMISVPLLLSVRLARRLAADDSVLEALPPDLPSVLLSRGLAATRRLAATAAVGAVALLVVIPFILSWLIAVAPVPADIAVAYDAVAGGVFWVLAAMGGSALVRFWAMSRARPHVLAAERRRRADRLQLHSEIMRKLERV